MDERRLEQLPTTPEFPALTREDLEEIKVLFERLHKKFDRRYNLLKAPGFKAYTGLNIAVGEGNDHYNSQETFHQLLYTLAVTRHPLVKKLVEPEFDASTFDAKTLVESRIMSGMKILDLGSGPKPVFARCCRAMDSDVWTVNEKPEYGVLDFRKNRGLLPKKQCDLEDQHHIELTLNNISAVPIIKEKSGGDFNLATEANLDRLGGARDIALLLLKKGGIYFRTNEGASPNLKE